MLGFCTTVPVNYLHYLFRKAKEKSEGRAASECDLRARLGPAECGLGATRPGSRSHGFNFAYVDPVRVPASGGPPKGACLRPGLKIIEQPPSKRPAQAATVPLAGASRLATGTGPVS